MHRQKKKKKKNLLALSSLPRPTLQRFSTSLGHSFSEHKHTLRFATSADPLPPPTAEWEQNCARWGAADTAGLTIV